ncbi:probable DNA helicase MCM9 isoform X2 [Humulus lupulus]|uniref:probable DNA helicase MCM9 isoform X2 n=1 Tax=Humulus lupulus TaxID=3486 RepID=UPI002B406FAB|nr:probable DNA helicase MCM9 isoform X2 [Humulus lupulus]
MKFNQFWNEFKDTPLKGRNAILQGVCPQIFGLFTVKLAVALTLIGGVQHVDASGTKVGDRIGKEHCKGNLQESNGGI